MMRRCVKISVVMMLVGLVACGIYGPGALETTEAQDAAAPEASSSEAAIRDRISDYLEAFNGHDAEKVGSFWTTDGISVNEETGQETSGREALVNELSAFIEENPSTRLTGQVDRIRLVRPNVATVEGHTTLFAGDGVPVDSTFTALLIRERDQWLISTSHERSVPVPPSPQEALQDLEWLIGDWQDDSDDALVRSSFQWAPSGTFLLRSFDSQFADGPGLQGTQIFGWDPITKQVRTWTFASDGSFGQGTVVNSPEGWMVRKWQVLNDGRVASATRIMTRVDEDVLTVETIAHTIDGEPVPHADPITVVRVSDGSSAAPAEDTAGEQSATEEGAAK